MVKHIISLLVLFCVAFSFSFPKSLGNKIHVKPLSDEQHYKQHEDDSDDDEHNVDYDHDAFLGKEEADEFDELSPEESKEKLSKIIKKIDTNGDGYIGEEEMREWLRTIQTRYTGDEVEKKWRDLQLRDDESMAWEMYMQHSYGSQETVDSQPESDTRELVEKDRVRWREVDLDKDGLLSKHEYSLLLHPEAHKETQHIYARETLDEMDADKDGKISLEEFLNDLGSDSDEEEDASWIGEERDNFIKNLDKDKDGYLDAEEVSDWLLTEDLEQVDSETEHLFSQADDNKDKLLSEEEVLEHYDVFVGSQATEYGDILHDEF